MNLNDSSTKSALLQWAILLLLIPVGDSFVVVPHDRSSHLLPQRFHQRAALSHGSKRQLSRRLLKTTSLQKFFGLKPVANETLPSISTSNSTSSSEALLEDLPSKVEPASSERTTPTQPATFSKLRRLKDLMWVRETLEDITAAEFACSVEASISGGRSTDEESRQRRKRAVDYEKLLFQLNRRIRDMGCDIEREAASIDSKEEDVMCLLEAGVGMGSIVYTEDSRQKLLERIMTTRFNLMEVIQGYDLEYDAAQESSSFSLQIPNMPEFPIREKKTNETGPKLYVRDDGTVDWDGALQDQAAIKEFGTAVWARINGRDPDSVDDTTSGHVGSKVVTAKIEETPEIREARERLKELSDTLAKMESNHTALISSVIPDGQAVANVNLAMLQPEQRSKIRKSESELVQFKEEVAFQTLVYELERIYTYLVGEIGNPAINGYIPLQDRLNVAEFGLLESQIGALNRGFYQGETVDADVLAVVMDQVTDFKRRLGIDYYVTGLSWDQDAIKRWLRELWTKTRKGFAFYVKGVQLFWNDIVFCLSLINRAVQGYTLKPREVRTIRRTFKDILTFIPFVIILLIPLTPVGHVLVFGAIQRFFPDFFPSCFTEQRQNLLQLYETAEYSEYKINESLGEKLSRISEAFSYLIANASRSIYSRTSQLMRGDDRDAPNND